MILLWRLSAQLRIHDQGRIYWWNVSQLVHFATLMSSMMLQSDILIPAWLCWTISCSGSANLTQLERVKISWCGSFDQPALENWLSRLAKRIAEIATGIWRLIATFSSLEGTQDRLVTTLSHQLALSISSTWTYIQDAIEQDPATSNKLRLLLCLSNLSIPQYHHSVSKIDYHWWPWWMDTQAQVAILNTILPQPNPAIIFLIISWPEPEISASFGNDNELLKFIHCRLALDNTVRWRYSSPLLWQVWTH